LLHHSKIVGERSGGFLADIRPISDLPIVRPGQKPHFDRASLTSGPPRPADIRRVIRRIAKCHRSSRRKEKGGVENASDEG
jgi:hypothetical protein